MKDGYPYEAIAWFGEHDEIVEYTGDTIIRCGDCRHSRIEGNTTKYRWCKCLNVAINDNDYCSFAERREP